jgi:hypothetical protein
MRIGEKLNATPPPAPPEREIKKPAPPKPPEKVENPANLGKNVDTQA